MSFGIKNTIVTGAIQTSSANRAYQGFMYDNLQVSSWESANKSGTESKWCSDFLLAN